MSEIKETIIRPKKVFSFGVDEIFAYHELIYFFTWKEIKVRYKQAFLGIFWTILQPLLLMSIFILLFSDGLRITTTSIPSAVYYLSGLLIWNVFSHAVSNASQSMVNNANIIKKIYFPRLIIPISAVLTASFDFLIGLVLFYIFVLYFSVNDKLPHLSWGYLSISIIVAYLVTIITAFSIGTFLSAVNVKYRDVRYVLPFLIQTLFFLSPVMYDTNIIKVAWIKQLIDLNPLTYAISIVRMNIENPLDFNWPEMSLLLPIFILLMYFIALITFRKTEAYFADIV